jgi:hypothetical protein
VADWLVYVLQANKIATFLHEETLLIVRGASDTLPLQARLAPLHWRAQ